MFQCRQSLTVGGVLSSNEGGIDPGDTASEQAVDSETPGRRQVQRSGRVRRVPLAAPRTN